MLVTHLVEIFMWSAVLIGIEAIAVFRDAFYYVAGTYTTLGYGEGTLPKAWRLLAPMIAISGLFAFGWTTGTLFQRRDAGVADTGAARRGHAFAKVISPPLAPTFTVTPGSNLPDRISFASGFSICCWIARFSGRAP